MKTNKSKMQKWAGRVKTDMSGRYTNTRMKDSLVKYTIRNLPIKGIGRVYRYTYMHGEFMREWTTVEEMRGKNQVRGMRWLNGGFAVYWNDSRVKDTKTPDKHKQIKMLGYSWENPPPTWMTPDIPQGWSGWSWWKSAMRDRSKMLWVETKECSSGPYWPAGTGGLEVD